MEPVGPRFAQTGAIAQPMRASPDGKIALFFGRLADSKGLAEDAPYVINMDSGRARRLAPEIRFKTVEFPFTSPIAISHDGRHAIADTISGALHRIISIPLDGASPPETLFTLTAPPWSISSGTDGSVYLDQFTVTSEVLRFGAGGGRPETIARSSGSFPVPNVTELPDGRVLFPITVSGRSRLLVARPGVAPVPLVETEEDTSGPAVLLDDRTIAFFLGSPPKLEIALATIDGRILKRVPTSAETNPRSLAASADGRTLYYADNGSIWEQPIEGGDRKRIQGGDAVVMEPGGRNLIIQLNHALSSRLIRIPLAGGQPEEIPIKGDVGIAPTPFATGAVRSGGRAAVTLAPRDSWFFTPGILDTRSGAVVRIPLQFEGDIFATTWESGGALLALGLEYRTDIWRFRPAKGTDGAD
jgi:hypothetical protein